ncbi:ATP-binding protein [Streptomyces sp. f51]|uniref:ATP-binding protein n=1 Tax=unclassified Streptomyces TaxID=2593676 RepID=UPI0030CC8EA6
MPASRAPRREPSPGAAHGDLAPGRGSRVPEQGVHPADGQTLRAHVPERAESPAPAGPAHARALPSDAPAATEPVHARARPSRAQAAAEPVHERPLPAGTCGSADAAASRVSGVHGLRTTVPAHPSRVPGVRAMVAEYLTRLRLPARRVEDAVLAAGELLTNALRHGSPDRGDTITVGIECDPRELRISVADRSSALPERRTVDGCEQSGRGLTIVAALSDDWGVAPADPGTTGKKVWFSMVLHGVP